MVEIEVHKAEPQCESTQSSIDINEIVGKVRDLIGNIREMGSSGEPMSVNVEGFNVALSKDRGEYEFALKLNLVFKPKTIVDAKCPG